MNKTLTCKLTTAALRERKATVLKELKDHLKERRETNEGFQYRFDSSDAMIDLVSNFVKTERLCCDFFEFNVRVSDKDLWLTLGGPEGSKEFILNELGL